MKKKVLVNVLVLLTSVTYMYSASAAKALKGDDLKALFCGTTMTGSDKGEPYTLYWSDDCQTGKYVNNNGSEGRTVTIKKKKACIAKEGNKNRCFTFEKKKNGEYVYRFKSNMSTFTLEESLPDDIRSEFSASM